MPNLELVIARDRTIVWRHAVRQVEQHFVHIAPAPTFGRIVAFDDRMGAGMKMLGRVPVGRIVAAADMTAGPADSQMQPHGADFQAFLAAQRARRDVADAGNMCTGLGQDRLQFLSG